MGQQKPPDYNIVIPIYEGVNLMDVAAPREIFYWMGAYWKEERTVRINLVASSLEPLKTLDGLILTPDGTFDEYYEKNLRADLLWVPGGEPRRLQEMMQNPHYLNFLRNQSEEASYVTSVCEGALLLASAGLLDGYSATTHWAFIPCLKAFPEIQVAEGYPRFIVDRNRVTGGGISSGLDEALKLVSLVSSIDIAKEVQLTTQYFPEPPFIVEIPGADKCPVNIKSWERREDRAD